MPKSTHIESIRQMQQSERRSLIVNTAIACFIKKGFHQTSIRDIANEANISLGNFYNYFESKSKLIEEIAQIEAKQIGWVDALLSKDQDPEIMLNTFIDSYLKYVETLPNVILTIEILAEAIRNPEIGVQYAINRKKLVGSVSQIISSGSKTKKFKHTLDNSQAAELILDMIEGLAMRCVLEGKKSTKKTKATLRSMVISSVSI